MATENLKERKIYRIMVNSASKVWDKIAFWTTAKSVDAADGNNLETKVGAIKGITTSTNTTTTGYAADATVIKTLNDSLAGIKFHKNGDGSYSYYGADGSLIPFNSGSIAFYASNTYSSNYGNQPFVINQINNSIFTKGTMDNAIVSVNTLRDIKLTIHFYCYDRGTPKGCTDLKVNGTIKNTFKITTDYSTGYFTYTISLSKNDVLSFEIPSSSTTGYKNDNAISIVAQVAS